ncbi:phosphatidylethanolamine-binding protein domain-containing protein [Ditylenchus destructor]|uniref:Phosphatidylethanolamine-binding protein domain-containing protein n=1 Tax=Ditylenchus destructor TaxID=166010 RepID=A0AAD4RAK3_9BILA|nr:phosphatidylethanolamine-binding protein domain-containing protein [Ditylenchus destructor]
MDFAADQSLMLPESDALREAFTAHLVLPDVLSKLPNAKLFVSYSDHVSIELGNLVMPEYVDFRPIISLETFNERKYYTLIMTDPDVPNRAMPSDREYLHWMITNITGNSLEKGDEIVSYEAPLPKKGSGLHRYVFILLEQSKPIVFDNNELSSDVIRMKFMIKSMDSSSISDGEQDSQNRVGSGNQLGVSTPDSRRRSASRDREPTANPAVQRTTRDCGELKSAPKSEFEKNFMLKSTSNSPSNSPPIGSNPNMFNNGGPTSPPANSKALLNGGSSKKNYVQSEENRIDERSLKKSESHDPAKPAGNASAATLPFRPKVGSLGTTKAMEQSGKDSGTVVRKDSQKDGKSLKVDDVQMSTEISTKQSSGMYLDATPKVRPKTSDAKAAAQVFQRTKFSTKDFMAKYMVRSVAAGNFFQTEYNDYVGERIDKLMKSSAIEKDKEKQNSEKMRSATPNPSTFKMTAEKKLDRPKSKR